MADTIPRFGASDFFLVETDPVALREQIRASLAALLGRDVVDSDPHMVLASAFLPYLVQGQASADACAKATLRAFAVGQDLDRIADATCVVGYLDRKPAQGAVMACVVVATLRRSSADAPSTCEIRWSMRYGVQKVINNVPYTTTFSGSGTVRQSFSLTDPASKPAVFPIYLRAEDAGFLFNNVGIDDMNFHEIPSPDIAFDLVEVETSTGQTYELPSFTVNRCGSTYGGRDAETDEEFAERVEWQARALRVPGSWEYYKLIMSEIPLLASWYVAQTVDAQGRIVVAWCDKVHFILTENGFIQQLTDHGEAYDAFVKAVRSSLLVGQIAYAYPAARYTDIAIPFRVVYHVPRETIDIASLNNRIQLAWERYLDTHAWHCGAFVSPSEASAVVQNAGGVDVEVVTAPSLDFSTPLPPDAILTSSQIRLVYSGLAEAPVDPIGADGEEIGP